MQYAAPLHHRSMRVAALAGLVFLIRFVGSGNALAGSRHSFSSKKLGFSLQYPAGWKASSTTMPGTSQLVLFAPNGSFSVTISVLSVKPGKTLKQSMSRFLAY